ncbi:phosphonate ABC transporter, permease protein PhnE [Fusobacterium sp.]|uniref:phosphonate ABC transporter, permease protein PhnE n=1 Tax=Fusobacterium sp. TaxID=68766 RepID=UPI002602CA82|nr:phosphonate ABC transporter, permease protein PhnE [Fusobacterium sp.]
MVSLEVYMTSKRKDNLKYLLMILISIITLGYFVDVNIFTFIKGIPDMMKLLLKMVHPNLSHNETLITALKETIEMSIVGSSLGLVFSIPFIFVTAENIAPSKMIASILNKFFSIIRTIPSLIWAAVLVSIFSIGKFSGTMALAIISFLMSQKLLRERVEEIKENELNSIEAVGANKVQIMYYAVIPSVSKHIVSIFFLILESNIRSATILGFVGAGGIGQLMWTHLNHLKYNKLATIIFILFFIIFIIDFISVCMRRNIKIKIVQIKNLKTFKFIKFLKKIILILTIYIFFQVITQYFSISFQRLMVGFSQGKNIFLRMLHPNFMYFPKIVSGIFESLYIALFATIIASILCLILSYFTACNSSRNKIVSLIFKIFSNILRTFPPMIVAIIFFRGLGPGKFAGAMALIVYTTGSMTKIYSEIIENVNSNIEDSIKSTGATNISVYYYALLKETYPAFIGVVLYRLESNIRNSTILGIIGAGGIGTLLNMNIIWRNWENVGMMILVIGIMIGGIDTISRKIRMRVK